ncbi:cytochrome P450 [Thozetella sp. PMI_491]|nr:cytochrome P450 [Thozetella sp. PMI_491]
MALLESILRPNDTSSVLTWISVGIIAGYVLYTLWSWYRLRHIPGPRLAGCSYFWVALNAISGNNYEAYLDLRKYGSLVRTGPNFLVTDDPDVLRTIAGSHSNYRRDTWYSAGRMTTLDTMISILDTPRHDAIKAKTARGYSGRDNPDLEIAVDSEVLRFVDLIKRKHVSTRQDLRRAEFSQLARYFTLDVITRLGYGKAFGYLDEGIDLYRWTATVDQFMAFLTSAADIPLLRAIFFSNLGMSLFGPKTSAASGPGRILGETKRLIAARFEKGETRENDMFGSFIRHGMTQPELEAESLLQLIAGSDTTSSAIRGTMLCILSAPQVYSQLKAEIKQAVEKNAVSYPIKYTEALELPYLQAVIWEGYRKRCPVVYGHFKVVPPGGDTINGYFVPGGTAIGHNSAALTHKESVFGPDADVFRPERFLECSADERREMIRALDMTFGGGRWMCAGKSVALYELNKIYFELFRAFDFQLLNPTSACEQISSSLVSYKNMWMRITEASL